MVYLKPKHLIIKDCDVLYWSYTDTKHHATSLRQQSFLLYQLVEVVCTLHYHDMKRSALGVTRSKDKADDRVGGLAEASFLTFLSWGFLLIIIFLLQTKQKVILHVQHFSDAVDKFATTLRQISSELGVLKIIEIITSFDGIVKRGLLRYTA